jgi:hypothetical protein
MLKRKKGLNYRKSLDRCTRCKTCSHFKFIDIHGIGGAGVLRRDWRCEAIGLENSRLYAVRPDHVCNEFSKNGDTII